jgi:hypothetical protein
MQARNINVAAVNPPFQVNRQGEPALRLSEGTRAVRDLRRSSSDGIEAVMGRVCS